MAKIKEEYPSKKVKDFLKNKKLVIAAWSCENKFYAAMNQWLFAFEKFFDKENIIIFDPQKEIMKSNQKIMNETFLKILKKEQPDFLFLYIINHSFYIDTLFKIKKVSPKTKIINLFMDDDTQFEVFSRYYSLFCDYLTVTQQEYIPNYAKEGMKNVFFIPGVDSNSYRPLNLEKKYDVIFIGGAKKVDNRSPFLIHLLENGINLKVFGPGWTEFSKFKGTIQDSIDLENIVKSINQSRINLSFSQNKFGNMNLKLRNFEIGSCKSFLLAEFCKPLDKIFKHNKDIVMFKNKEELLEKVKYYLKHEKEREKLAAATYETCTKKYDLKKGLNEIFLKEISSSSSQRTLPKISKKTISLKEKDLNLSDKELKSKLKDFDYVAFQKGRTKKSPYKNYFQAYSLQATKKPISCCSYYAYSKQLGNYLFFSVYETYKTSKKENFLQALNINQIVVDKKYFLENKNLFTKAFKQNKIDFLNEENTAFISLPLIQIEDFSIKDYETIQDIFEMKFLNKFQSLIYQKKFSDKFIFHLLIESVLSKPFIIKHLLKSSFSKDKINSMKRIFLKKL